MIKINVPSLFTYKAHHFYEKIYLFDRNLLKTQGASYNRVFSLNKIYLSKYFPNFPIYYC